MAYETAGFPVSSEPGKHDAMMHELKRIDDLLNQGYVVAFSESMTQSDGTPYVLVFMHKHPESVDVSVGSGMFSFTHKMGTPRITGKGKDAEMFIPNEGHPLGTFSTQGMSDAMLKRIEEIQELDI